MAGIGPLSEEGLIRLLDHHGNRVPDATYDQYVAHLTMDDLRSYWRDMTLTRAFDMESTSLQRQGELGLWVPAIGQEAAQIGSARDTRDPDHIFPSYREHGVLFVKGVDLPQTMGMWRGMEHSSWDPTAHGVHTYTLVIGAHSLHAVGYAQALNWDGLVGSGDPDRDGAVVCYVGDGATSQGDVNEALIFSAVNDAPVVFFIQNNQFAISEPTTRQSKVPLAQRAQGVGIPGVRVDGNDVVAVHAVTRWALEHARSGNGPVVVEALTYRMGAHTTSDDPTRYRAAADEQYWQDRDPIARLDAFLRTAGELPADFEEQVREEGKELARRTREAVKGWQRGPVLSMFDNVYAEPHPLVDEERAWFARYESSFADTEVTS